MAEINRQIVLDRLPQGDKLAREHFRLTEGAAPSPGEGEVLLRTRYISLDAANRAWMQGATYRSALNSGDVMAGGALAEVVASNVGHLKPGDVVFADTGWQDYVVLSGKRLEKLPQLEPMTHLMSVYGIAGLTAYFGLLECGKPKAGETVVVSAAAGSVGSIVGQIAKIKGCRVVGVAGGAEKGRWLVDELGFDAAIDYKAGGLRQQFKEILPEGIDVYFDNTGGEIFEACLFAMKNFGRIACCGAVSQYDGAAPPHGPRGIPGLIVTKRLSLRGFVVMDFDDQREAALKDLQGWVADGRLKVQEDIIDGLENTPAALIGLLNGENRGKRMIRVRG
ncbi:NADP-dependent oxidoreductase [Phenylobacterium sp.]|jgi:NADPH-dependent curcumin reductase CurA|uniref:NADP-dependent oxidoreductase n=1 Tax=Phenylobacterium sp. TaxID=1871053 RepID=UPI001229D18D|nr:NADP-dependent oxidoreductase [Phenylobacterium sp.]THD50911.1 MAG: NADP-dependent oxidoreductase [Phenylobacterium sp.]